MNLHDQSPAFEVLPLTSNLPYGLLRDLNLKVRLNVDHEGSGQICFEYDQIPPEHHLQALLTLMGALDHRLELALGREAHLDLLRGVLARLERT